MGFIQSFHQDFRPFFQGPVEFELVGHPVGLLRKAVARFLGVQHFNKFTGTFGFRYLRWNFDSSSDLENLRVIGPYVGARWTF
jgi:hypothetical protein